MGTMGVDGQSIAITNEQPGSNCQNGGLKLTSGTIVSYVCNGLNGSGSLAVTPEPAGANCANGGVKVQSSSGTSYVCNGSSSSVTTMAEPPGANCAAGGVKITSSTGTNYVCNGTGGGGSSNVLDSGGNVLGQFKSMFPGSNSPCNGCVNRFYDVAYVDGSGTIVIRNGDGTLDPQVVQPPIGYTAPLCQGTPYLILQPPVLANVLVKNGSGTSLFKGTTAPPAAITVASVLQQDGTCNPYTQSYSNAQALESVTNVPATVPGPLAIQ